MKSHDPLYNRRDGINWWFIAALFFCVIVWAFATAGFVLGQSGNNGDNGGWQRDRGVGAGYRPGQVFTNPAYGTGSVTTPQGPAYPNTWGGGNSNGADSTGGIGPGESGGGNACFCH